MFLVLGFGCGTGNCLMVLGCRVVKWFAMWSGWYGSCNGCGAVVVMVREGKEGGFAVHPYYIAVHPYLFCGIKVINELRSILINQII